MTTPKDSVKCEECGGLTNFSEFLCSVCWQEYYPDNNPAGFDLKEDILWPPSKRTVPYGEIYKKAPRVVEPSALEAN